MSVIKTHTVTLRGGNETWRVVLRPFCDAHLPYLCKWCADPTLPIIRKAWRGCVTAKPPSGTSTAAFRRTRSVSSSKQTASRSVNAGCKK